MKQRTGRAVGIGIVSLALVITSACSSTGGEAGGTSGATGGGTSGTPTSSGDGSQSFAGRSITVQSWGGAVTDAETAAFYRPFEAKTGAKVNVAVSTSETLALLKKQVDSGSAGWDVVTGMSTDLLGTAQKEGLIENIDYAKVPGADKLADGAKLPDGLGYDVEGIVAAYSTKEGVKPLKSMADFFDTKNFPGPRGAANWGIATLQCEVADLAAKTPEKDMYPINVDSCLQHWKALDGADISWYDSGSQMAQSLVSDDVDYCMCYDGRVNQAAAINADWKYTYDGSVGFFDYASIVSGTKNADIAHALLEFMTTPEAQAAYSSAIKYSPSNPAALELLPQSLQGTMATSPDNDKLVYRRPASAVEVVQKQTDEVQKAWDNWVSSR